jgi:hypothetical protein
MVGAEPLGADGERVGQVNVGRQHGGNETLVVELDDRAGVRLDGVPFGAEDEDGLTLLDQTPRGGDDEFTLVRRNVLIRRPVGCLASR